MSLESFPLSFSPYEGSAPPASPVHGQQWVMPLDGAGWTTPGMAAGSNVAWLFRYNANSASAYKWEFIGGSRMLAAYTAALETISSINTWLTFTNGPRIIFPRNGDYDVWIRVSTYPPAAGQVGATLYISPGRSAGGTPAVPVSVTTMKIAGYYDAPLSADGLVLGCASGETAEIFVQAAIAGAQMGNRVISILPRRVS